MKTFKRFLNENYNFMDDCHISKIFEKIEREMTDDEMIVDDHKSDEFVVLHHSDDETDMANYIDECLCEEEYYKEYKNFSNQVDEKKEDKSQNTELDDKKNTKPSKLVFHDKQIIADGQQKIDLLKKGWVLPVRMHRLQKVIQKNGKEKIVKDVIDIDFRDASKYFEDGYIRGQEPTVRLYNKKTRYSHKYIDQHKAADFLEKHKDYKIYQPIFVSEPLKDNKYRIYKIDASLLPEYLENGFKEGIVHEPEYYNSFFIASSGGKVQTVNLSLTPVDGCPSSIPCRNECYALREYNQYPNTKCAWDKNLHLLREGRYDWLIADINGYIQRNNVDLFRWHVAGDILNKQHLDALEQIAIDNGNTTFWLYTKNIDVLKSHTKRAENLIIIISAWNNWRIKEIEKLHEKYPVAYFDDSYHRNLIPSENKDNVYVCPCANYLPLTKENEKGYKCRTCITQGKKYNKGGESHPCYTLTAGESVIFREH